MEKKIIINLKESIREKINKFSQKTVSIDDLLVFCTDNNCSDLYIKVGQHPRISRYGIIYTVPCFPTTERVWKNWAELAINSERNAKYVRNKTLDMSYFVISENSEFSDYRYRVNAGFSTGKNTATFRMITKELPTFETINFPATARDKLYEISKQKQGITLLIGATGMGKSTTLASMVNDFSKPKEPFDNKIIISMEDPVEYIYPSTENTFIIQEEYGIDFKDFAMGVRASLRQHPNIIIVGETRDLETINSLINGAMTGHNIYSTFHASDCSDAIARLYNNLVNENPTIMYDLIRNINMLLCQRLVPSENEFKLDVQYMVFTDEIRRKLISCINNGGNIPTLINELFSSEELARNGVVKQWNGG